MTQQFQLLDDDDRYMARAIRLARRGLYTTRPNPRVGCVLVRDGQIIGEGFHRKAGEPHAEPLAIQAAGGAARGATAYVTLEPCCHQGRTPPCTKALIRAGISRVVAAMQDPNPKVAGKGLAALELAGIRVASGCQETQAAILNPGFIKRMRTGRPYVRCKLAMSLDGRTAMADGESRWITGSAARTDVHRLRARSDAIVTGLGTVIADDPSLNVRLEAGQLWDAGDQDAVPVPLRVVLDPRLEMPPDAVMTRLRGNTLIVCCEPRADSRKLLEQAGMEVVELPGEGERISLNALLDFLGQRQVNELLIESGPTLAGAAVGARLVDELVIYAAPHLMGDGARGLLNLPGLARMEDRIALEILDLRMVGRDIRLTLKPEN